MDRARHLLCAVIVLAAGSALRAQPAPPPPPAGVGMSFTGVPLNDLPLSGSLGGLFETIIPEIISDRIDGGGLSVGSGPRLAAGGSPWSQTAFQLGELDLTDAGAAGRSLLFLDPAMFESIDVSTAQMSIDRAAPGASVRTDLLRPTPAWHGRVDALFAPPARTPSAELVPPISALRTWGYVAALVSGPLIRDRLGIAAGVVTNEATRFDRSDPTALQSAENSFFVNTRFTPSAPTEVWASVIGRVARVPFDGRLWFGQPGARERLSDFIVDSTVIRRSPGIEWKAAGGYARSDAQPEVDAVPVLSIDSIDDQPIMTALAGSGLHQQWSAVFRANGTAETAARWLRGARGGVELDGISGAADAAQAFDVAETVAGFPARVWRFAAQASGTNRHATSAVLYGGENFALGPRVTIDAGIRGEIVRASATGGGDIHWNDWFPRLSVRWEIVPSQHLSALVSANRYGYRPTLESLAYADPAAPSADVFRWTDVNGDGRPQDAEIGPLISRTGGAPAISSIDPALRRPYMNELVVGFDMRPSPSWTYRLVGFAREERQLIAGVNTGVPASAYTVIGVPDVGFNALDPSDDQLLPLYSRRPETFGADRYLLTNPSGFHASSIGAELSVQHIGSRLWLIAAGTAVRASGPAMARGFRAQENDRGIPGDLFSDPNAATFSDGRYFGDRAYTLKTAGTYRFAHEVRLGVIARYQDGQPFSRLVIAPDLAQGVEAVRAYPNGRSRFTFTLTVDTRVQKEFAAGRERVAVMFDVFNLINLANEVEEFVLSGVDFRASTAVQPPRALHFGVRLSF